MPVNRTGDETAEPTITLHVDRPRRYSLWIVPAAMVAYALLKFSIVLGTQNLVLAVVAAAVAYLLGIYLYRGIAELALRRRTLLVIVFGLVAGFLAGALTPAGQIWTVVVEWCTLLAAAWVIGWRARQERSQLRIYLWGLAAIVIGGLVLFVPQWPDMMRLAGVASTDVMSSLEQSLIATGYHADAARDMVEQAGKLADVTIRLMPAATIMNLMAQFSVGFIWFMYDGVTAGAPAGRLRPFCYWKVPFWVTPGLIVIIAGRLLGSETIVLVADNLLAALSIYYCLGGLALTEHSLRRIRLATGVKVLFYILLTLTGLLGYLALVLLGFIDSFADWRNRPSGQSA